MRIYLIANNLLFSNLIFDENFTMEEKMAIRPLNTMGRKNKEILNLKNISRIYSANQVSCIENATYLAEKENIEVLITNKLNDCKVGNLKNQSIKMLSYFQEHDFNFKQPGGESLNECSARIARMINYIGKTNEDTAVFLPRRAILSYLLKHTKQGFNLDDRLVLLNDDEVLMENTEEDMEIFELINEHNKIKINRWKNREEK